MTRAALFLIICLFILSPLISAEDQSLETALNNKYHDKILALRHSLEKSSQVYDADGNVLKGGHEGPWTLYGRILVDKIHLEKDSIRIEGKRLNYVQIGQDLAPTAAGKMKIQIQLAKPTVSAEEMNTLLAHVFALTDADVIESAPVFWQKYLKDQIARAHGQVPADKTAKSHSGGPGNIEVVEPGKNGEPVGVLHKIGPGTTAPKPKYTPEPDYSDAARKERYQGMLVMGIIVNETGKVQEPKLIRPLGMGLDEKAISKVLTWKFDPAKMDDKPVPVILRIEVSFNLY